MEYEEHIGKIALDKQDRKLGKIIKVEKIQEAKTRIWKSHFLILVKNFLQRDVVILMEVEKLLKNDIYYVWFDILKEDFNQEVMETRALIRLYGN